MVVSELSARHSFLIGLIALLCSSVGLGEAGLTPLSTIAAAFNNQQSNLQVLQEGAITRILSDDTIGDRHQRMIIRLGNNQTLLITHNVDLAPRVPNPSVGKILRFYGEYEWNAEGGVVHWTHKDPDGVHVDGWLEYAGKRYGGGDVTNSIKAFCTHKATDRISTELTMDDAGVSLDADKSLFDIRGRFVGKATIQASPGIYFVKSTGNRPGSVGIFRK